MKTQVVQILIRRGLTSQFADVVLAHEVPVLQVARGSSNVELTAADCSDCNLKPTDIDPRDEFIRLKKKYVGFVIDGQNPVDVAFPDGSRDLELFYKDPSKFDVALRDDGEGGGIIGDDEDEAPAKQPEVPDDPEELTPEQIAARERFEVMEKLDDLGVPYGRTTSTKHLKTLLERSVEAAEGGE